MKILFYSAFILMAWMLWSCAVEPVPIDYGKDACHFCEMNIVDRQHAAEIVTTKGKAYKYDAVECMLRDRKNWKEEDIAFYLIAAYDIPGKIIQAKDAAYLVCEQIPSPMGANLSGFSSREAAEKTREEKGGMLYDWKGIKEKIK